jgi:putative copper resistance protein D
VPDVSAPVAPWDLLTEWHPDLLTGAVLAVLVAGYLRARLAVRAAGPAWPGRRDAVFAAGMALAVWSTSGFPEARGHQLMWVWISQQLVLFLLVPLVLMAAQPVSLVRAAAGVRGSTAHGPLARIASSRLVRTASHPALGMLYVPVVCALLVFAGVGTWSLRSTAGGAVVHLALLGIGAVIALPLVDQDDRRTSLAVGLTVAVGAVELLLDAVPGIVLRLETHVMMPPFATGRPPWSPSWLADQQTAGAVLWTVAELLDLPFLVLVIRQWIRVEKREARRIDAELDALDPATAPADATAPSGAAVPTARPWWLDHPELRGRFGRDPD